MLGTRTRVAGLKVQTNPLGYGDTVSVIGTRISLLQWFKKVAFLFVACTQFDSSVKTK